MLVDGSAGCDEVESMPRSQGAETGPPRETVLETSARWMLTQVALLLYSRGMKRGVMLGLWDRATMDAARRLYDQGGLTHKVATERFGCSRQKLSTARDLDSPPDATLLLLCREAAALIRRFGEKTSNRFLLAKGQLEAELHKVPAYTPYLENFPNAMDHIVEALIAGGCEIDHRQIICAPQEVAFRPKDFGDARAHVESTILASLRHSLQVMIEMHEPEYTANLVHGKRPETKLAFVREVTFTVPYGTPFHDIGTLLTGKVCALSDTGQTVRMIFSIGDRQDGGTT